MFRVQGVDALLRIEPQRRLLPVLRQHPRLGTSEGLAIRPCCRRFET
jgi:hypothetical protein